MKINENINIIINYSRNDQIGYYCSRITNDFQKIIPLLAVYLAAGFRILPGIVKLSGYLQTIRGLKPSLDLLYKEFDQIVDPRKMTQPE